MGFKRGFHCRKTLLCYKALWPVVSQGHSVYVLGLRYLLRGSWDLVTRVISKVNILLTTYDPH